MQKKFYTIIPLGWDQASEKMKCTSQDLTKKVMQLAALRVKKLHRVAEGELSYHMRAVYVAVIWQIF